MDSGNSGSLQSSSGGDEEYDSRAESISALLNNNHASTHVGPIPNPPTRPPPQPHHHHHHHHHPHQHSPSSMFDPLSNYFDNPLSSRPNPNSFLNLDMVWPKTLRSEPNCTDLGGFMAAASSSSSSSQQLLTNQALQSSSSRSTFPPALHIPQGTETSVNTKGSLSVSVSGSGLNIDQTNTIMRNPKKRSRASRRAPTTVLTTDTTNFRAMVQEFTGIPAPPFTSSPFPRTRLDLFGNSSTLRSSTTHLDPSPPPYLLRPFAQKFHPPPFVSPPSTSSSSSMIDAIASTSSTNLTSASTSNSNSTSINYQLSQHPNLLNMNNMHSPILNLQSLLQPQQPKYNPLSSPSILGNKPQGSTLDNIHSSDQESHLKIGVLEELGLSHGHLNTSLGGLQNLVSSDATLPIRSDNTNPPNWPPGDHGTATNENDQGLLRSISGNYNNSQRVSNGKVNTFSASTSDFHREKGQENVATTRTEGMVESWICSSD